MNVLPKNTFNKFNKCFVFCAFVFTYFFLNLAVTHASGPSGVSVSVDVFGNAVEAGHIVSLKNGIYMLSFGEYDDSVFGVVANNPALSLEDTSLEKFKLIATSGQVMVRVSAINGPIKEGDYITTSRIPGTGQKADVSGQVIGIALENFDPEDKNKSGEILVFININSVLLSVGLQNNLVDLLRNGFKVPFLTPLTSLRYILAAVVALVAFFIGFTSFGRISTNSIEALGRNPLASKIIKSAIFLNFTLTITIFAVGIVIAYLILSL